MTNEKLIETIKSFIPPEGYAIRLHEVIAICEAAKGEMSPCVLYAFHYGFLKGQRAEKAAAKRKQLEADRREMAKHARGYGLLMALIEKNRGKERFVRAMITRATTLADILSRAEETDNEG